MKNYSKQNIIEDKLVIANASTVEIIFKVTFSHSKNRLLDKFTQN